MSRDEDIPQPPESFPTKQDAIRWMIDINACQHKEARTKKSDTTRVHFQCTKEGCEFSCHINKSADGLFRIAKWSWHTCGVIAQPKVKRAWIVEMAKARLEETEELEPKELQRSLKTKHGVDVKAPAARKALAKARMDRDDNEASFDMLPGLFEALKDQNPGTVAEIAMEEGRFVMAFLCPGPCARAWTHCPKIIALDGGHGTSAYKGVVLMATAMDGAGQIFPIALGFAPSETNDSWRYFVRHLADALGIHDTPLTVISDRCKGIDNGVAEYLPRAAHSYCTFHISKNVLQFGQPAADFVWKLAYATTKREYKEAMAVLRSISPKAHEYIKEKVKRDRWVRAFFPLPRYGHITSNIAESSNSSFLKIRKYPPMKLFVKAVRKINATFEEKRALYANRNPADIVDKVWAVVVKNVEDGRRLAARSVGGNIFDVDSQAGSSLSRTVDLGARTCSCLLFQDLGYPCIHACSAALKAGVDIATLCIDERRVGSLQAVYQFGIVPVDLETIQPMALLPPLVQRQTGRPKVKRIRSRIEDSQKRVYFCSFCHKRGHNVKTCPEK